MWIYSITGKTITAPDGRSWPAYSGHGQGLNNPALESVHQIGPLPRGRYKMTWYDHIAAKGNCVAVLTPVDHDACGRTGLMWHGDDKAHPGEFIASHGCLVSALDSREAGRDSGDDILESTE